MRGGWAFCVCGPLGAGKTTLCEALVSAGLANRVEVDVLRRTVLSRDVGDPPLDAAAAALRDERVDPGEALSRRATSAQRAAARIVMAEVVAMATELTRRSVLPVAIEWVLPGEDGFGRLCGNRIVRLDRRRSARFSSAGGDLSLSELSRRDELRRHLEGPLSSGALRLDRWRPADGVPSALVDRLRRWAAMTSPQARSFR